MSSGGFSYEVTDGHDEWLTPPKIIASLGEFDLDPCACTPPRPWDTAKAHFSKEEDGFNREWVGRVWLNPPYGRETKRWITKLAQHGNGVALITARTETTTFFPWVWDYADAVMFLRKRLHFHYRDGSRSPSPVAPSVLVAYGKNNATALSRCGLDGKFISLK